MSAHGTATRVKEHEGAEPRPTEPITPLTTRANATHAGTNGDGAGVPRRASGTTAQRDPLARLQKVAHQCSQAILRGYDEQSILDETCRLLVEGSGYTMSWIARATPGEPQEIVPLAQTGLPVDFEHPGRNGDSPQDPVQKALASRRPQVVRNIPQSTNDMTLREHAGRWGYAAQCTIPLRLNPDSLGFLTVYSQEKDAFGSQELVLLRGLTGDLEQGLANLQENAVRERREADLQEAKEHYARFFENSRDGVFTATLGGRLRLANPAFARLLGFPDPQKLLRDTSISLYTLLAPRDKRRLMNSLEDATHTPLEMELQRPDRAPAWVQVAAERIESPEGPHIKAWVRDLTPVRTERETEHRLRDLIGSTHAAILSKDLDGVIQTWNRGAEELYGVPADQAVGRPDSQVNVPDDQAEQEKQVADAVRNGRRVPPYQTRRVHKDGSHLDVCVMVSPMDRPGSGAGYWVIEHEIARNTDRPADVTTSPAPKNMMSPGTQAQPSKVLEEAVHAINSTLTVIVNRVELARAQWPQDAEADHLEAIQSNAFRLAELVKDLDDIVRMETDATPLEARPSPLHAVVDAAFRSVQESARRRDVQLEHDVSPTWTVTVDRPRLDQAITRLLEQAVLESPPGSTIKIRTLKTKQNVRMQIAHHEATAGKNRGPESTKGQKPSTAHPTSGLRRHIAKRIIQHHGGRLETHGGPNGGPTSIVLPVSPEQANKRRRRNGTPHPGTQAIQAPDV